MTLTLVENHLVNIAFGLLLFSLFIYWGSLYFPNTKIFDKIGNICLLLANFSLFINLLSRWIIYHYFPLSNLYESLLFLTWCLTTFYLILNQKYNKVITGAIVSPISLFTIAFASLSIPKELQLASPLVPALRSNWLMMHVTIMMMSYATLLIGSLIAIAFLVIKQLSKKQHEVKNVNTKESLIANPIRSYGYSRSQYLRHNRNIISNINLLESLDNLSYRTIGLGFPLLTIGIIAGAVWANEAWGSYWSWDPKETWALITWIVFATYLHTRLNKAWSGEKPAILATFGFFIVWICYLGVNFLGQGLHSYGWLS
uniref:Cytochrome c biogenesis protein CcsA n=1 Tax=Neogoniolithon spectabile TaxID=231755 RepID=A0A3G3MH17_9FLOR|nr:cytochrome c biogenesis protein [Neogoniolithon spectabile]AYR06113.1 cytochrome c biogenesis protein [Neogoniolithon spectabile]